MIPFGFSCATTEREGDRESEQKIATNCYAKYFIYPAISAQINTYSALNRSLHPPPASLALLINQISRAASRTAPASAAHKLHKHISAGNSSIMNRRVRQFVYYGALISANGPAPAPFSFLRHSIHTCRRVPPPNC